MQSDQLTDYQAIRSENIRNNELFLASLGLNTIINTIEEAAVIPLRSKRRNRCKDADDDIKHKCRRSSARLRGEILPEDQYKRDLIDDKLLVRTRPYSDDVSLFRYDQDVQRISVTNKTVREFIENSNIQHGDIISDKV